MYKKCDFNVLAIGAISSHLPMKHPFIVPGILKFIIYCYIRLSNCLFKKGGRFIETYFWDNYWILSGLLISGMFETAKTILENHMHLIEIYGFIPNRSRVYYLNR